MDSQIAYIGTFTSTTDNIGIQPIHTGDGLALEPAPVADPSFLISHPSLPVIYTVSEQPSSTVSAYAVMVDGSLQQLNALDTGGDGACHLAFDAIRNLVVVAHYEDGSVAICSVNPDGSLDEIVDSHRFTGRGPDTDRQAQSHAHMAIRDGEHWLIADLGADRIHRLGLDDRGAITEITETVTPPGSGPRHLVIDGDLLILACELSAELWLARRTSDGWQESSRIPCSQTECEDRIYPSGIVRADDRIVVANRGSDTIATFQIGSDRASVTMIDEQSCAGKWPRDLTWYSGRLWVANERSDSVAIFAPGGERWQLTDSITTPSPTCIGFVHAEGIPDRAQSGTEHLTALSGEDSAG